MTIEARLHDIIHQAADAGAEVLLQHFGRIDGFDRKGKSDLVTVADKAAERAIVEVIRAACPDHAILAEESAFGTRAPSAAPEWRWVIDPLDGTANFAHGVPIFSVSIALQHRGETMLGLVLQPVEGTRFFAARGEGATCDGEPLRVSRVERLDDALLVTGFPHARHENIDHLMRILGAALDRCHGVSRLGSAALDLCWVAMGRFEAFWEERLQPWDVAAGNLIVQEAGGRCTNFAAERSTAFDASLLASNGRVHDELLRLIEENWTDW